ncbi:TRAP transporter substrate-binding protein [Nitratireductor sp. XY-223]|uniref:TRAP transporter substrate-binding protein n=1 Tax=Nitratireductor sp. XY-223 TaxID=2561926 RepID=UPI0010AADE99|nr:TRAP transporter substrate-binding protein [Nitratireductor sp. XY-223]
MTRRLKIIANAFIISACMTVGAKAEDVVLRMSSWLPPSHPIVKGMMVPWSQEIEKATDGRVSVQILDAPLGPPPAHFDLAANGVVDLTYGVHGYTPGRFKLTEIAELPFLSDSAEALSVAYWKLYESDLAAAEEHRGVKVLGVFTHGPGILYTKDRPVTPLDGLDGAKIRVAGSVTNQLASGMDMVAIQAPAPQSYELLSGGVADGIFFPAESIPFFKLDGLLKNALEAPGGLYNVSFFFVMNQNKFDSLSDADKAAIESASGEAFARLAGKAWDAADAAGRKAVEGKVAFHEASADELQVLEADAQPIFDGVKANYTAAGLDFEALLNKLKSAIAAAQ